MASKKKNPLPFDKKGGIVALPRRMLTSSNYLSLSAYAKALLPLMQTHWRNDKPVDYGVKEAEEKIPCAYITARKVFYELQEKGFIEMIDESFFSSRTYSKTRTWRLTWLPFNYKEPTREWEKGINLLSPSDQKKYEALQAKKEKTNKKQDNSTGSHLYVVND